MTKTLVERLRERAAALRPWRDRHLFYNIHDAIIDEEAADSIDELERENQAALEAALASKARIEKLEAALRPFAEASDKIHSGYDDGIAAGDHPTWRVPVVDLRTARAAYKGE